MRKPSEPELRRVERELRRLPRGTQRAVGGEVYMRLARDGARRFQYRGRRGFPGGTCASWEEAYRARQALLAQAEQLEGSVREMSAAALRKLPLRRYAQEAWWPECLRTLEPTTLLDHRQHLPLFLELVGERTLEEFESKPLLIGELKRGIEAAKRFPPGHRRAGQLPLNACDHVLKVGGSIGKHALERGVVGRNPFVGISRFARKRTRGDAPSGMSNRRVRPPDVKHPRTLASVGVGMRGDPLTLWQRRLIAVLIVIGMRPQDICAFCWCWCRDEHGPLEYISGPEAVKDIAGYLTLGEPKTGERMLYQFPFVAELLDRLYLAQGSPSLETLSFPNAVGGLLDWGNFRTEVWYPALRRGGISRAPENGGPPSAADLGAFEPYLLRHIGATIMLHATRHDGEGLYSPHEVARQFGNSAETINRIYGDVLDVGREYRGKTMDEILRQAWREVWGPMPGEPDYRERLLTTVEAAKLTGISVGSLDGRIARGTLPARREGRHYLIGEFDLRWAGLLPAAPAGHDR